jgi:mono/diheme cytochrome c family protein
MRGSLGIVVSVFVAFASTAAAQNVDGQKIFNQKCALCHGKNGAPPPAFAKKAKPLGDVEWQKSRSDEQIRKAIEDGVKGTLMASFKEAFTPGELDALVKHIRTLETPAKNP